MPVQAQHSMAAASDCVHGPARPSCALDCAASNNGDVAQYSQPRRIRNEASAQPLRPATADHPSQHDVMPARMSSGAVASQATSMWIIRST